MTSPRAKLLFYVIGVVCFAVAIYLFLSTSSVPGVTAFWFFLFAISFTIFGARALKAGYNADEKYGKDQSHLLAAQQANTDAELDKFRVEQHHYDQQRQRILNSERDAAEIDQLRLRRREIALRSRLLANAEQYGIDVDSYIEVNKTFYKVQIGVHEIQEKIRADMDAADRMELTEVELIEKLNNSLLKLLKQRRDFELSEKDEWLREQFLGVIDERIATMRELIDVRHERLLLPADGEEKTGISKRKADRRPDYPPAVDEDGY